MTQGTAYTGPQPGSQEQVSAILAALAVPYPEARYDLNFSTPLELFVATQLSAQCTDERVNAVTKSLFQKYRSVEDYANVSQEEFEQDIKSTGFYRNKAKNIRAACQHLLAHHNGEVPRTMEEMVKLPGVARKTANVILGNAFGISVGFIVDTHVGRLARRFGWTQQEDAVRVEQELMRLVPQEEWLTTAHRMIYHGRALCVARSPRCPQCPLVALCPSATGG
ncbi:MAG TPA: endonuclease III [Ktedonobacteraceae bacterium]|nr:endonuclease III [Ktedonobacteraceae bacterium]